MIVYNCPLVPFEFFKALDIPAKRIQNSGCEFELFHSNICSFCKNSFPSVNPEEIVIWVDSCDSMRRSEDFLKRACTVFDLHIPVTVNEKNVDKLAHDLRNLWNNLKQRYGEADDEKLIIEHKNFQKQSEKLLKLLNNDLRSSAELYEQMTCQKWIGSVEKKGIPILILGAYVEKDLIKVIEDSGGYALNGTCSGPFAIIGENLNSNDVFKNMAFRILKKSIVCMRSAHNRDIEKIINFYRPSGIILHTIKFCDFYGFDEKILRNLKIPFTVVENDLSGTSAQLKTRMEALIELVKNSEKQPERKCYYFVGIDSGSTTTKIAVINKDMKIVYQDIIKTGAYPNLASKAIFEKMLAKLNIKKEAVYVVSTGYGRSSVDFADEQITEITCHAKGVYQFLPQTRTVIDIGGQDSKVIRIENGKVIDFVMNDKCAAGTGRFLEVMANVLDVPLDEIGELSLRYSTELSISSVCTVFAESEVISLRSHGHSREDILHAVHLAIARRIGTMCQRVNADVPTVLTGGVAQNRGVKFALEKHMNTRIDIPKNPVLMGAIGAALIGAEKHLQ
ncbi:MULTISPECIES: acyl-CoA dehydratase activase [Pseudothermotoga]|uniref:Putative CoA-substrate-specific enzyme activase n=1 Tax=Pseudothermotoga lettingae (strain ATCC BAA-301 / DSM 14385 / NBRC 107922 / TMO) TaxID=416591 RepID=A8F7B0_PSELT|nr:MULTISPECIES: acyl-CoA dehydratase activase [Pseudothermotoga]ABV34044.1 putative CoA-substrate-specific enzyme activase [Pseudothermotoga lettingae TMO]MDI3494829.1 hypothetical protein [Pseudothermotoga sp.]GLI49017.1 bifunctional 2-hydroxyacyl-CoA dehydratase/activator domain-containing protein [Pseudothermotoga lettingae TMO]